MNIKKQRGEFLMESLIGMLLMAIIGGGVATMTASASRNHGESNLQELAITQMRLTLIENGFSNTDICASPPTVLLPNADVVNLELQGCDAGVRATTTAIVSDVNGALTPVAVSNVPAPIVMQASSVAFPGTIVVGGSWN